MLAARTQHGLIELKFCNNPRFVANMSSTQLRHEAGFTYLSCECRLASASKEQVVKRCDKSRVFVETDVRRPLYPGWRSCLTIASTSSCLYKVFEGSKFWMHGCWFTSTPGLRSGMCVELQLKVSGGCARVSTSPSAHKSHSEFGDKI